MYTSNAYIPEGQAQFKWGRHLGSGGLGRVDEIIITESNADRLPVGASFACKRLNEKWAAQPDARERFEREINALRSMSHPNIVTLKGESLTGSNERFYAMQLFPSNLRTLLATKPRGFEWTNAAGAIAVLADAMAYAHAKGFIHRDIKPENVLLTKNNNPVIADWGLGYFVHKESKVLVQLTRGGMGTEYYCSLEQWNTGKCDETGDIYSLGVMLAELVTGRQVPMALGMHGTGINEDVLEADTQGARKLNNIIKKMTELMPEKRIQSMTEVARQLRQAVALANTAL